MALCTHITIHFPTNDIQNKVEISQMSCLPLVCYSQVLQIFKLENFWLTHLINVMYCYTFIVFSTLSRWVLVCLANILLTSSKFCKVELKNKKMEVYVTALHYVWNKYKYFRTSPTQTTIRTPQGSIRKTISSILFVLSKV